MVIFSEMQNNDQSAVINLWNICNLTRPWNDPVSDIAFAIQHANSTIIVGRTEDHIVATAMVGHDRRRGALYYVEVGPNHQNMGIGAALMGAAESWLKTKGVWKINVLIREDNLGGVGFYKSFGFEPNAVISMGKQIS